MKEINQSSANPWGRYGHLVHARSYDAGHGLFEQGDGFLGLFRIKSGLVGLRKVDENGATMLVGLMGTGDFVGYAPLLVKGEHLTSAEVLQPSTIEFVCAKAVQSLAQDLPGFLSALFCQATRDLSRLENRYLQMGTEQAHTRLARLLLTLRGATVHSASSRETEFQLPIMHKDMADLIGVRPETLSRAIAQLRLSGVAEFHGRTVHLTNPARLVRMVGSDSVGHRMAA